MSIERNEIPNLRIENIGTKRKPHNVIKGFVTLPCWNGYYLYDDTYKPKKNKVATDGRIELWVEGAADTANGLHFSGEQIHAYWFLVEHQESIKHSILQGLKREFARLLSDEYGSWDHEHPAFPQPAALTGEFDFKDYIGPESISIGEDARNGAAYLTWRFRCRWDVEHGLDIITHKERVIEIAPEADPWKISQDNGTYEEALKEYNNRRSAARPPKKKKWWQCW